MDNKNFDTNMRDSQGNFKDFNSDTTKPTLGVINYIVDTINDGESLEVIVKAFELKEAMEVNNSQSVVQFSDSEMEAYNWWKQCDDNKKAFEEAWTSILERVNAQDDTDEDSEEILNGTYDFRFKDFFKDIQQYLPDKYQPVMTILLDSDVLDDLNLTLNVTDNGELDGNSLDNTTTRDCNDSDDTTPSDEEANQKQWEDHLVNTISNMLSLTPEQKEDLRNHNKKDAPTNTTSKLDIKFTPEDLSKAVKDLKGTIADLLH